MVAACIVFGLMTLLFLAMGIAFSRGKGQGLIAGWNTMSEKEREKYEEKKLMKLMAGGMFVFAGCMVLVLIGLLTGLRPLRVLAWAAVVVTVAVLVVRANTAVKKK